VTDQVDQRALLEEARGKARRLIAELRADQADLEAHPPRLPADQLAQGRLALLNAIASATRVLAELDDAARDDPCIQGDSA
jgi:regulator of protease activity HflC (stomatin/prohibitin superfamily)